MREVMFALYGLPSSLFEFKSDGSIDVVTRYVIAHSSPGSLNSILDHFASKAMILQKIRNFAQDLDRRCEIAKYHPLHQDATAPNQSFVEALQNAVAEWEAEVLVPTEELYVVGSKSRKEDVMISLFQLQKLVDSSLERFTPLYEIVVTIEGTRDEEPLEEPSARVSHHLELLFKATCEAESNGQHDNFRFIRGILLCCLKTYLRPIATWMEAGEIRPSNGQGSFFVHHVDDSEENEDASEVYKLSRLWHGQYVLDRDEDGNMVAPSFIQDTARKIFVTGKSVLFLRKLEGDDSNSNASSSELPEVLAGLSGSTSHSTTQLTSFNDALLSALSEWVDKVHRDVSARLRDVLYWDCGLWDSLDGIIDVFFMRDGYAATSFCTTLFERIDKNHKKWNDRFLLTELMQSVYSENYGVDISRLTVKSKRQEMTKTAALLAMHKKNIKVLSNLSIDYRLSWPVLNVITPESLDVCREVWSFLLMIRRGRNALERMRLSRFDTGSIDKLIYTIRWKLLTFISLLHSYLVDLVSESLVPGGT
jgi:gamma-tubulin complex component 5